jgi:N-acetylmuramoyl-L-alanine amidase
MPQRSIINGLMAAAMAVLGTLDAAAAERAPRAPTAAAPANAPVASEAKIAGDESRTRFVLELSRTVELQAFMLADPYRVIIDLPQIAFQLPAKTGERGRGLIKAFRYGTVMAGGSRIVIDTSGPVRIDKVVVLDAVDGQRARMLLDLVSTDRATFLRNLTQDAATRQLAYAGEPEPEMEVRETTASIPIDQALSGDSRPVIVIDPGHGGMDAGTIAESGEAEKAIVLDFAVALRERLEKSGKYKVLLTRTDDTFISLPDRVSFSRKHKAALFISIHADALAVRDPDTRGATIYTLSEDASDAEAARLAEAENKADVIAGIDLSAEPGEVADILIELAQRETKAFSAQFARTLVHELRHAARLHKRPLRSAGFRVLKASDTPSVLVELGYVSSPQDLKLMTSETWRRRTTDAMHQAVTRFFSGQALAGASRRR